MKKKLSLAASLGRHPPGRVGVLRLGPRHLGPHSTPTPQSAETEAPNPSTGWELNKQGGAARIKAAGLDVLNSEGAAEHFHAHLDIFVKGKAMIVPADIGFEFTAAGKPTGISALHTHDESGIIHVRHPSSATRTP